MTATTFEQRIDDLARSRPTKKEVARAAIEAEDELSSKQNELNVTRQQATEAQAEAKSAQERAKRSGRSSLMQAVVFLLLLASIAIWWFLLLNEQRRDQIMQAISGVNAEISAPVLESDTIESPPTGADDSTIFAPATGVPAEFTRVSDHMICLPEEQPVPQSCNPPVVENPCDIGFQHDLEAYFEHRDWNPDHIHMIRAASEEWEPTADYTPIDLNSYTFWGDDGPNLRAFIRDQRFGYSIDGMVVQVTDSVRYTIFRCDCGITAIYREVRIVRRPPPQPPRQPPHEPPTGIPEAWCVDSQQRRTEC